MQDQSTLPATKRCVRCFETKPAGDFYVVRGRLSARCRVCHNGGPAHPEYVPQNLGRTPKATRPSLVDRACEVCGGPFVARRSAIARGQGRTCSLSCANKLRKIPEAERFAALVALPDEHGCRFWTAATGTRGYGRFTIDGSAVVDTHRYAYEKAYGPILDDAHVLHGCDIYWPAGDMGYRRCVEPSHLFTGSHQDNMTDRNDKKRQAQGVRFPQAKLTDGDVRDVRRLRASGLSQQAIADLKKVSQPVISGVLRGVLWKHVP